MEPEPMTFRDILSIVRRRRWWFVVPLSIVFIGSLIAALVLPPVYRSTSTILIEQQVVPQDFGKNTNATFADQQLQTINQRIMTSERLLEIVKRFQLYPERGSTRDTEDLVAALKDDIILAPISVTVNDPRAGRSGQSATIAFTLSYEATSSPEKVHAVAQGLAELFLQENQQVRQRQATQLSGYLQEESTRLKEQIQRSEEAIAQFKARHINDLPELLAVNIEGVREIQRSIDDTNTKLKEIREKEGYLRTQLANTPPEFKQTGRNRLNELQVRLVELKNHFSDEHPDVIKTKAEIAMIEKQIQSGQDEGSKGIPDNPAYITLASQLSSVQSEIVSTRAQLGDLNARLGEYRRRVSVSPQVESEYKALLMERDNAKAKHDDLMRKFMDSQVSQGIEESQNWERFSIIDPARVPQRPVKPNRLAMLLIGLALGVGAGVLGMAMREFTDDSVRDAPRLTRDTAQPVLASIPVIVTERDETRQKAIMWGWIIALAATAVVIAFILIPVLV